MRRLSYRIGILITALSLISAPIVAQSTSSFEVRHFSSDPKSNGETDFRGETEFLTTEQRLEFLDYYAQQASCFYKAPQFNFEVAPDSEVAELMRRIKPAPKPTIRTQMTLDGWKYCAASIGDHQTSIWNLRQYDEARQLRLHQGSLQFMGKRTWLWHFPIQTWRFNFAWKAHFENAESDQVFHLMNNADNADLVTVRYSKGKAIITSNKKTLATIDCPSNQWHTFKIEADMVKENEAQHLNFYFDQQLLCDFVPVPRAIPQVDAFYVEGNKGLQLDSLTGMGFHKQHNNAQPFYNASFINEQFEATPAVDNWYATSYNDATWQTCHLPYGEGGDCMNGKSLYFRKYVQLKDFERAILDIETIDPNGELWINNQLVEKINDRYPLKLDITRYLKPHADNLLAVKVNPFYLTEREGINNPHTGYDKNFSWFMGRASLSLTNKIALDDAFVYTETLKKDEAHLNAKVTLDNTTTAAFKGVVKMEFIPWNFNSTQRCEIKVPVRMGVGKQTFQFPFTFKHPTLWEPENPSIYKVIVSLQNEAGETLDDYVLTTGIRTLGQTKGTFLLNNKPYMLNGAQIMGQRTPIEKLAAWLRCPTDKWVAKEMLMTQKMGCNLLRLHVHGWKETAVSVNDPRYAEIADQMGIMLIYGTPSWIREGDWGQIDFAGYHKYIKQLQNHPSIVMWELSNHPNTFYRLPSYNSEMFCEQAFKSVYPYDPSRLITYTSFIGHLSYADDEGNYEKKKDKKETKDSGVTDAGNQTAIAVTDGETSRMKNISNYWTAPMVTRGNQDAPTGYGMKWTTLRKWPTQYYQNFLNSKHRAYFNFETQESIGQPNWELCKGQPWYKLYSYERGYDYGSIGKGLDFTRWKTSQGYQAFSGYEAIKKMRLLGYDGFSWCTLHGGANSGTYMKPAIDPLGYAKLIFYSLRTVYQKTFAGSSDVDVVYGPDDKIQPVIYHYGDKQTVTLTVQVKKTYDGEVLAEKTYRNIKLKAGTDNRKLPYFHPEVPDGNYFIEYILTK